MFHHGVVLLCLAGVVLSNYPVSDDKNCQVEQKFVTKAESKVIRKCNELEVFGELVRKSTAIACIASDGATEIPVGQNYEKYDDPSKLNGLRIACKKNERGQVFMKADACLINKKVVEFGSKEIMGEKECTCEEKPEQKVVCKDVTVRRAKPVEAQRIEKPEKRIIKLFVAKRGKPNLRIWNPVYTKLGSATFYTF